MTYVTPMPRKPRHESPCCKARSIVRSLHLEEGCMILRCTQCHQLRIDPLPSAKQTDKASERAPHLRLIVTR